MDNEQQRIEYYDLIVVQNRTSMSICEFLDYIGFDANRFAVPIHFWFELSSKTRDEWFVLTNELIDLIGFKSCDSNTTNNRSHLFRFIRKHFIQDVDFSMIPLRRLIETRGGAHYKYEIRMKKIPFKKMLIKVGTSVSDLIHDYLIELDEGVQQYALYQNQCQLYALKHQLKEMEDELYKKDRHIEELEANESWTALVPYRASKPLEPLTNVPLTPKGVEYRLKRLRIEQEDTYFLDTRIERHMNNYYGTNNNNNNNNDSDSSL